MLLITGRADFIGSMAARGLARALHRSAHRGVFPPPDAEQRARLVELAPARLALPCTPLEQPA